MFSKKRGNANRRKEDVLLLLYYRLRRCLGMSEISAERLREQTLLHPGEDAKQMLRAEDADRLRKILLCLFTVAGLAIVLSHTEEGASSLVLTRPGYGEDASEVTVRVEYGGEQTEIPLELASRLYTQKEWEQLREKAWENACDQALGENTDWEHVCHDLDFSSETGIPGITVTWQPQEPEWISYDGTLADVTESDGGKQVRLHAILRCEQWQWECEQIAILIPPVLQESEQRQKSLKALFEVAAANREETEVRLPGEAEEGAILYYNQERAPLWIICLLGLLAAAAFWLLPEQRRREQLRTREQELTLSYSELVGTLTVLMGAGLTVRGAWGKMVELHKHSDSGSEHRTLYEEMRMTWNSLGQGVYEEHAYADFGKRCGLKPYLRLGSLLETNLRKGAAGLIPMLREEADIAMEERLQLAKRQGEEVSTRLLLPMLILFSVVLIFLLVPAFLAF